tara:strand:+ start:424 stop:699 length:276 start_codon:yes stop_codon:yes gene_type:complete
MIFFNRHKKTGKDIGKSVRQTVLQAFQIYGKEPPGSFFLDDYIYGFVNASVTNLMTYVFGGKDWSLQKKVNVLLKHLRQLIYCFMNIIFKY